MIPNLKVIYCATDWRHKATRAPNNVDAELWSEEVSLNH